MFGVDEAAAPGVMVTTDGTIIATEFSGAGISIFRCRPGGEVLPPAPTSTAETGDRWFAERWGTSIQAAFDHTGSIVVPQHLAGEVARERYVVLRRFHPDGTEDTAFGNSASAAARIGPPGVCRLLTDGSIDRSFGFDGLVTFDRRAGFGGLE